MNVRTKLILFFILVGTIPVLTISALHLIQEKESAIQGATDSMKTLAESRKDAIELILKLRTEEIQALAAQTALRKILTNRYVEGASPFNRSESFKNHVDDFMNFELSKWKNTSSFYDFTFLDSNGIVQMATNKDRIGEDWSYKTEFTRGLVENFNSNIYLDSLTNKPALNIVCKIPLLDSHLRSIRPTGVVIATMRTELITKVLSDRTGLGVSGETYLLDNHHTRIKATGINSQGISDLSITPDSATDVFFNKPFSGKYLNYGNEDVIGSVVFLPNANWTLGAEIKLSEVDHTLYPLPYNLVGTICILFLFILSLALFLSRTISKPILKTVEMANALKSGDLTYESDFKGFKEIKELINALKNIQHGMENTMDVASRKDSKYEEIQKLSRSLEQSQAELDQLSLELDQQIRCLNESAIVSITDVDGKKLTYVNDKFCKISGYSREELIGQNHNILESDEKGNQAVVDEMWQTIRAGKVWKGEIQKIKKGGQEYYWVDSTVMPFKDSEGNIVKFVAIRFDITGQKNSQEELTKQAEELAAQTEELKVNEEELLEMNSELENHTQKLQNNEDKLKVQQEELIQTNQELELQSQKLVLQSKELREKNKVLETIQIELEKKAIELERISGFKSEFLANMSHELRTPLNSILLLSELLYGNKLGNLKQEQLEYAHVIHNAGTGLLELINDILDLSKVESGISDVHIESISLISLTKTMRDLFAPIAKNKGINCTCIIEDSCDKVIDSDRIKLEQVLKNLLSNALKFTKSGSVNLRIFKVDNPISYPHTNLIETCVFAFEVKDTGIGITEENINLLFDPFRQVDGSLRREYGGTGLGLAISRKIATLLRGELHVSSKFNEGSVFTLLLPVDRPFIKQSLDTRPIIENEDPKENHKNINYPIIESNLTTTSDDRDNVSESDDVILIVDNDINFDIALIEFIRLRGYKAIISSSGESAVSYAVKYKPIGILLDVASPAKNGWIIMNELKSKKETKNIPIYMMSSAKLSPKTAQEKGALGVIDKPLIQTHVKNAIKKFGILSKSRMNKVLVVEDNEIQQMVLKKIIETHDNQCICAISSEEALNIIEITPDIDCIIIDLNLPDDNGLNLIKKIRQFERYETTAIIVHTGQELSTKDEQTLRRYASTIVLKTNDSHRRLMDEIGMFLSILETEKQTLNQSGKNSDPYVAGAILRGRKVLIVDDDSRNIFSISKTLEDQGIIVVTAPNGIIAIDELEQNPDIELILMDIMMPEMDGYEAMTQIRKNHQWATLPIIALTAKAMKGDKQNCIDAGASDYIAKPINAERLLSLLKIWLQKK